jgi:hypothetical protein
MPIPRHQFIFRHHETVRSVRLTRQSLLRHIDDFFGQISSIYLPAMFVELGLRPRGTRKSQVEKSNIVL